jgi:hypothetical protein
MGRFDHIRATFKRFDAMFDDFDEMFEDVDKMHKEAFERAEALPIEEGEVVREVTETETRPDGVIVRRRTVIRRVQSK